MDEIFSKIEKLIEKQSKSNFAYTSGEKHSEYQKTYFCTNEHIDSYLNVYDITKKNNALCVTASGDQLFNLINKGIYDIDTFDSNKLSEYLVFGLKRAMILKYSYQEYLELNNRIYNGKYKYKAEESRSIILDLLPYMDEEYRIFWKNLIDIEYKIQKKNNSNLGLFHLLYFAFKPASFLVKANTYMLNEEEYNKLKSNLGKANITYAYCNAINLDSFFKNKNYDLILMSNILDYFYTFYGYDWQYNELKKYILKLENITNDNGIIFLNYLFNLEYYFEKSFDNSHFKYIKLDSTFDNIRIFSNSGVRLENLIDEEVFLLNNNKNSINDGILLKRVQK